MMGLAAALHSKGLVHCTHARGTNNVSCLTCLHAVRIVSWPGPCLCDESTGQQFAAGIAGRHLASGGAPLNERVAVPG